MSLKKMTRIDKISQLLIAKTGVSIRELAVELGVSEITIRRDLKQLEQQGTVKLINGVAIHRAAQNPHSTLPEYNLDYEVLHFGDRKARIGKKAASLIEPNDVIAIDTGSTCSYLTQNLPSGVHLTVLTYCMNTLAQLTTHPNYDVICAGGYLYPNTRMFYSPEGISLINRTCVNKAFLSTAGISGKLNVTCVAPHEMNAKSALMESSQTKILLLDSSKFSKICPPTFAYLSDFDIIVTDDELSAEWQGYIADLGIQLLLA